MNRYRRKFFKKIIMLQTIYFVDKLFEFPKEKSKKNNATNQQQINQQYIIINGWLLHSKDFYDIAS